VTLRIFVCCFFFILLSTGCNNKTADTTARKVYIEHINGKYTLYRCNKPFVIKGAAGYTNLDVLAAAGGNTIRIWDTTNVDMILQQANKHHIAVIMGLPMPESRFIAYYNDPAKVARQFSAFQKLVNKYKKNPAVLMWCVGNELSFPFRPSYGNFYKAFNRIVKMIHHDDPDHPVTTTIVNFNKYDIFNIKIRTDVDIVSFNIFGRLSYMRDDLKSFRWLWRGPFMITEWGVDGPWLDNPQTAWGAYIEATSTNKAQQIIDRYRHDVPVEDPRFLGAFIFYWGQKQETTQTWFSLFDENGGKTEVVGAAQYLWTGKWPLNTPPQVKGMLIGGKSALNNLIYKPGYKLAAEVVMQKPNADITKVQWQIFAEDWYKKDNLNSTAKKTEIGGLVQSVQNLQATFVTPAKPGPYRVFATLFDRYGNIATCNIPFYVLADNNK